MLEESSKNIRRTTKDILPITFLVMKLCGLWQPFNSTPLLRIIYIFYSIFMLFTMISVGLALLFFIIFSSEKIKNGMVENSFLLFTLLHGWMKAVIFLLRHRDVKFLLNILLEDQCQSQDSIEFEIQKKSDEEAKKVSVIYSSMITVGVFAVYLAIFTKQGDERAQALNTWRPYELNLCFWLTWFHEVLGHFITASVHIVGDTMVPGFIIQLCCQLHFLQHRLYNFPHKVQNMQKAFTSSKRKEKFESSFISKSVVHHNTIFRFSEKIKTLFMEILFAQFVSSLIAICITVFKISKDPLNFGNALALFPFLTCMTMQLFLYCFYGNELMFNSSDLQKSIFETNWFFLEKQTKQSLIIMMIRCKKPILLSIGSILFVNLNSFASILKASYSAYNVLQHSV